MAKNSGFRNIALIGFRGTGKSAVGRLLAQRLGGAFLDMDEKLVESMGMDIREWVELHGWESFRDAESKLLASLAGKERLVAATGGGVVLREENRAALKAMFEVVWLRASSEVILARLAKDPKTAGLRPSLTGLPMREEVERLLLERNAFYEEAADEFLDTDDLAPEEAAGRIYERVAAR
jgi:shikimate kinase